MSLSVDAAARAFLVDQVSRGQTGGHGAQHVRSVIKTHVMAPLAQLLLMQQQQVQLSKSGGEVSQQPEEGAGVRVSYEAGRLTFGYGESEAE